MKMQLDKKDFEFFNELIETGIEKYFTKRDKREFEKQIFNISQTASILNKTYNFVSRLISKGHLKATADSKYISGKEINTYLGDGAIKQNN